MKKKGGTAQTSHERLDLMVTMRGGEKKKFWQQQQVPLQQENMAAN